MRGKGSTLPADTYQKGYLAPPGRSPPHRRRSDAPFEKSGFDAEPESTQDEKAPVEYEAYNDERYISDISEGGVQVDREPKVPAALRKEKKKRYSNSRYGQYRG